MCSNKYDDNDTNISFFKKEVKNFVEERNWAKYHTPKNLIQALSIELAELSELFLFKNALIEKVLEDEILLENIENEIADVFIYLISFINIFDLDLTQAFLKKMKINRDKYPTEEFGNGNYYKK